MDWFASSPQNQAKKYIVMLSDPAKQDAAVQELVKLDSEAVPLLIDSLQTQDMNLLHLCQQILVRTPSSTPALIKALTNAHPLIRGRVAEILGVKKDKAATPVLLDALKGEYYTVRSRAAIALGTIGDSRIISDLLPLLKDKEVEVRSAACTALGKFGDPSTFDEITNVLLDDVMIEVRQAALHALGDAKNPAAIPYLMEALRDSFWWFEREQAAKDLLDVIEKMGPSVVEPLIEALGDKEVTVRKYAAMVLGNLGDKRAIEELGMTLYDLHNEVSKAAADSLSKFGSSSVDILIEGLKHPEAGIRVNAVGALGKIKEERVVPALINMVHDTDRSVLKQVLQSLGGLKDQRALPALQEIASNRADRELSVLAKQILEGLK